MREPDHVGTITTELLLAVNDAPMMEPKDLYVESVLEKMFGSYDWTRSFTTTQVLVYDETLPSEILIIIHRWLRRKCADIENVCLVINHHMGIAEWWKNWCKTNHQKSFSIKEVFHSDSPRRMEKFFQSFDQIPSLDFYLKNKNICRLFSFYGGNYSRPNRQYLLLKMLEFSDVAEIDFLVDLSLKQEILNYVEHITYYKNQAEIDFISEIYDKHVGHNGKLISNLTFPIAKQENEKLACTGFQWEIDRHCWASVIRETADDDVYPSLTEKTIRCFLNHVVAIPIGFKAVSNLEKLGFWFPQGFIDYSYQFEDLFALRVNGLVSSLRKISKNYQFDQLQKFYLDNLQNFQHNVELAYKYINKQESFK